MQKEKVISFIIPAYNVDESLQKQCIESILQLDLTREEREIIVIDDGSEKPCPIDADWWDEQDITYLRQKHKGPSAARNMGIGIASGKYIQFVDCDDMLFAKSENYCLDVLRKENADILMFHFTRELKEQALPDSYPKPIDGASYMRTTNLRGGDCGYVFRKSLLGSLRFEENLLHEDELFTPQLVLRAEKLIDINATPYYYRPNNNSITSKKDAKWIKRRLDDFEKVILELNKGTDTLPYSEREAMKRRVAQLATDYMYNSLRLTKSVSQTKQRIKSLKRKGIDTLPNSKYTWKYFIIRKIYEHIAAG